MHSCSCCSSHAEFWPETKQGRNQKALNPKTEIETTARNSTERNETILATQSSRKADREYSSIFKFYGTNKQRQNRRSKRGGIRRPRGRGTYPHNSLWEIKRYVIESLLTQMAHDQLHFGLQFQLYLRFSASTLPAVCWPHQRRGRGT